MRGFHVLAIKENIGLYPKADAVYGCDKAWWEHKRRLHGFRGLKICWSGNGLERGDDILTVNIAHGAKGTGQFYSNDLSFEPGIVGGGGNSGFQALNLVAQWGAKKIVLIGFDMNDRRGVHWYGRNQWPMANNPDTTNFRMWKDAFAKAAVTLKLKNILVFNVSPDSDLDGFTKMKLVDAVKLCL